MNQSNKNQNGKKSHLMALIITAIIFVVVIILAVVLIRGCVRKVNNLLTGDGLSFPAEAQAAHFTDSYYSGSGTANAGVVDSTVASGVPEKRTQILGNGNDTVTIMMYICASDLESGGGAATMDIKEMLKADLGSNVNLLLYTGGTTDWQNNQISSDVNQIYQVRDGKLYLLEKNAGNQSMTESETLSSFIRYCSSNFPANRNMLIFWDHGGGSITGFGYDEKYSYDGNLDLVKIRTALADAGTAFDFIGFDACLMANFETGLAVSGYSDYLIASEESESGYGWYYTDWLNKLGSNTSIPTVELGQVIVDDFISSSIQSGQGWAATLSVVDLAELSYTVPSKLEAFAASTTALIENDSSSGDYKTVSEARSYARSFGESYDIDQVDLADFAEKLGTSEGLALAKAVKSAVKYNNTTSDMTNSYGISIFFPFYSSQQVNAAEVIYNSIGMPSEYTRCIQSYAAMELSGQYINGGSGDVFNSLYGIFGSGDYGDSYYYGNSGDSGYSSSSILDMIGSLMGGDTGGFSSDYDSSDFDFFRKNVNLEKTAAFLAENQFLESNLEWKENEDGIPIISMSEDQWGLISSIELNMFYDDGEGLIDMGSDNVYQFDDNGNLLGVNDHTWLSIDGHPMAYYYDSMTVDGEAYVINGHSPILYNGKLADMILRFDTERPFGYITGIRYLPESELESANVGKILEEVIIEDKADLDTDKEAATYAVIKPGDTIEFLADFYDYEGNFQDQYVIGDPWLVTEDVPEIANIDIGKEGALAMYCFTDIYQKKYWTGVIPESGIIDPVSSDETK